MRLLVFALLVAVCEGTSLNTDAEAERGVRMKTKRQLVEILKEVGVKTPASADKEELRKLALKHDAVAKWEKLHPEKKKKPRGGTSDGMNFEGMGDMLFPMLDKDKDGRLSKEEVVAMGAMVGGGGGADAGAESSEQAFQQMDTDGDGWVSKAESLAFFAQMASMMQGMGGMGGMGNAGAGSAPSKESKPNPASEAAATDAGDDDLPSHDEL